MIPDGIAYHLRHSEPEREALKSHRLIKFEGLPEILFAYRQLLWLFLTYYAKSIAKSVKISEQIYRKVNQVLVKIDI